MLGQELFSSYLSCHPPRIVSLSDENPDAPQREGCVDGGKCGGGEGGEGRPS